MYTVYKINSAFNSFDPTLEKCLFGSVRLTENTDIDKCKYSGYGIGFDSKETFMFANGEVAWNIIIFGAEMSSSVHVDNKIKNILILSDDPTQGVDGTTLAAKKSIPSTLQSLERNFV